jgi:predicted secreted protein
MAAIMGEQIQVFLSGKTLACATSCKVNISADEIDISCKDSAGFANTLQGKISWNVTSDNLFVVGDYTKLVDAMLNKTILDLTFASVANFTAATEADADGHRVPTGGWTSADDLYHGKVTVSSIDLTADNGQVATYSVTFNGHGALTKETE